MEGGFVLTAKQKSKLSVMIVFWSVMFIADIFIIAYGLLNLFLLSEYLTGALALLYGIIDVYGNWWHISVGLDQFAGRVPVRRVKQSATDAEGMPAPEDDADSVEDLAQDDYQPKHSQSSDNSKVDAKGTLKKMFGLTGESKEQQLMELRRNSANAEDLADGHPQVQDSDADKLVADSVDNPLDRDAFADLPLNKKRELMGKHHQAESQASSESAADSNNAQSSSSDALDSALDDVDDDNNESQAEPVQSQVKKGYDLNQIPTVRLAAMPDDRRKPGDAMPDDWVDDEETDKIIAQTKARMEADAAKSAKADSSSDAKSEASTEPEIDPNFDPNDDNQIEKMIARYDRERAEREAKQKKAAEV